MSSWRTTAPADGPRAKCDQVVYEAIAKAAEIIVLARCPIPAPHKPSSSRFNLHVPEVDAVRASLQRWRRSLHVPLRLDVYYQHEDSRELLERWCLEYTPCQMQSAFECANPDPIVQLRHVCKKIVISLRTLYSMARLLPAHSLYQSHKLSFELQVEYQDVPQFRQETLPPVPTPYGPLQWKVCYAPNIRRLLPQTKTMPIPMAVTRPNHISAPPQAQSAPAVADLMNVTPRQQRNVIASSNPKTPPMRWHSTISTPEATPHRIVQRSNSLEHSTEHRSGLSLALLAEESSEKRRTALHHAPPVESSYGYAYNNAPLSMDNTPPTKLLGTSPSAAAALSSTPPLFCGSATPSGPLIPPRQHIGMTPPFATLPTALSEPDFQQEQDNTISSLDLLHSSPFQQQQRNSILGSFSESDVLKHSVVIPPAEEEDMPFAVDEDMEDSAVTSLAHKCATASRLQLFESTSGDDNMVSSLADQLAEFKSFGASLHLQSSNHSGSKSESSSTLISMRI